MECFSSYSNCPNDTSVHSMHPWLGSRRLSVSLHVTALHCCRCRTCCTSVLIGLVHSCRVVTFTRNIDAPNALDTPFMRYTPISEMPLTDSDLIPPFLIYLERRDRRFVDFQFCFEHSVYLALFMSVITLINFGYLM